MNQDHSYFFQLLYTQILSDSYNKSHKNNTNKHTFSHTLHPLDSAIIVDTFISYKKTNKSIPLMEALQTIPEPKKTQPTLFKNNFLPILKPLFSALPWQLKKTYSEKETLLKMPENQDQLTHIKTYLFNKLSHHFQSKNFSKIITDPK